MTVDLRSAQLTASLKPGCASEAGAIDLHRIAAAADHAEAHGAGGLHGAAWQAMADALGAACRRLGTWLGLQAKRCLLQPQALP
ncbi:hypothetical protein [Xanthomonas citri]|uniref:hypothetical protein n=1 Tax=Xanthomonas citri TaxID=346 RepID=UPI000B5C948E|nr:hypothetical protein [Xanthomonas citri]ASL01649.1 hypothetical protein XcvCFBP7113P_15990 [Xanthomonas citri pv. vignicola]